MTNQVMAMDMRSRIANGLIFEGGTGGSLTTLADGERISGNAGKMGLHYESLNWEAGAGLHWIGANFRAENGYLTQSDVMGINLEIDRSFYPENPAIRSWKILGNTQSQWKLDGSLRSFNLQPGLSFRLKKNSWAYVAPQLYGEEYEGKFLSGPAAMWMVGTFPSRYWGFMMHGFGGKGPYYDPDNPRVVNSISTGTEVNLRPTDRLSLSLSGSTMQFWEDAGELENGFVGRAYVTAFLNHQIWLRSIADFSSFTEAWKVEGLFAWQKSPGTAFYLGGSTNLSDKSWQTFAKLSWALGF
jgi:hypothetical protein